jgi:hypothetical protein
VRGLEFEMVGVDRSREVGFYISRESYEDSHVIACQIMWKLECIAVSSIGYCTDLNLRMVISIYLFWGFSFCGNTRGLKAILYIYSYIHIKRTNV